MLLDRFLKTGREFLGSPYPIMCGAMTWVSDPKLVSAVGNAGGFGLLAGGNMPVELLRDQIEQTRQLTSRPFGINIITLAPAYPEHLNTACDMGCEFIVFCRGHSQEKRDSAGPRNRRQSDLLRFHRAAGHDAHRARRGCADAGRFRSRRSCGAGGAVRIDSADIISSAGRAGVYRRWRGHRADDGPSVDDGRCRYPDGNPVCDVRRVRGAS